MREKINRGLAPINWQPDTPRRINWGQAPINRVAPINRAMAAALAAITLCWSASDGAIAATAAPKPATHTVTIEGTGFTPATLTVNRGDTVTWINKDPFPHTATAPGVFDSKIIAAGKSWRFTAQKSGTFAYICTLHPNMKATLVVR
jgi:plastocyanin